MSQDQAIIFCLKAVEIASVITIAAFVGYYTRVADWWANPIGRTIVIKDVALILVLVPSILSIFFHFSRLTSHVAAWFDICSFGIVPVVMVWRIVVWHRIHKAGSAITPPAPEAETSPAGA